MITVLVVVVVGDTGVESGSDGVSRARRRDLQILVDAEGGLRDVRESDRDSSDPVKPVVTGEVGFVNVMSS